MTGSFGVQHYGGTDVSGAIERVFNLLDRADRLLEKTELQLLSADLIRDAGRLAIAAAHLIEAQKANSLISSESVEVISRKVLEHAILLEYLLHNKDDEKVVSIFLKRCRAAYTRSFQAPGESTGALPNWPNYEQMAKTYPALYAVYRRLSYLAHPKTCVPYSFMERESRTSAEAYFEARSEHAMADLATVLHIATDSAWVILDMVR